MHRGGLGLAGGDGRRRIVVVLQVEAERRIELASRGTSVVRACLGVARDVPYRGRGGRGGTSRLLPGLLLLLLLLPGLLAVLAILW